MTALPVRRGLPNREELSDLSVRIQGEQQSRFDNANRDFVIGSTSSWGSLGIGIEVDEFLDGQLA